MTAPETKFNAFLAFVFGPAIWFLLDYFNGSPAPLWFQIIILAPLCVGIFFLFQWTDKRCSHD